MYAIILTGGKQVKVEVGQKVYIEKLDDRLINVTLKTFLGKSAQTPPMYSAIKVNGRPLYSYARNNETVDVADREIEIRQIFKITDSSKFFSNIFS